MLLSVVPLCLHKGESAVLREREFLLEGVTPIKGGGIQTYRRKSNPGVTPVRKRMPVAGGAGARARACMCAR